MNLAADPINIPAPQLFDLGLSTINALDKSASLWTPTTRVGRPTDVAHGSAPDHICGKVTEVRDRVSAKSDYSYKNDFEIWRKNQNFERQKNAKSRPPLDSTPVGTKMLDPKIITLTTELSKCKEKSKRVRTIECGVRNKLVRLIIDQI